MKNGSKLIRLILTVTHVMQKIPYFVNKNWSPKLSLPNKEIYTCLTSRISTIFLTLLGGSIYYLSLITEKVVWALLQYGLPCQIFFQLWLSYIPWVWLLKDWLVSPLYFYLHLYGRLDFAIKGFSNKFLLLNITKINLLIIYKFRFIFLWNL